MIPNSGNTAPSGEHSNGETNVYSQIYRDNECQIIGKTLTEEAVVLVAQLIFIITAAPFLVIAPQSDALALETKSESRGGLAEPPD